MIQFLPARQRVFLLLTCGILLCGSRLHAQTDSTGRIKQLEEVEIRTRLVPELRRAPVPVQVLSSAELERLNSLNVADAVRFFSGIQLKDYGGIGGLKTIDIRAIGSSHVGVFYDGVQLGNMQNGQVDLGRFSLDNLEQIAVYNGQRPGVLLPARAYASAAAVYMDSKMPEFGHNQLQHLRVSLRAGSYGLINPALSFERRLNKHTAFRLSTELMNAQGGYSFRSRIGGVDTQAVRQNTDVWSVRAEAGLYGHVDSAQQWQVKVYHYRSERGLPRAIVTNRFQSGQRQWDQNTFMQARYERKLARLRMALAAKYSTDVLQYQDQEITTDAGFLYNKFNSQELYSSLAVSYQIYNWWEAGLSADYQRNNMQANLYRFSYPVRQTVLAAAVTRIRLKRFLAEMNVLRTAVLEDVKFYLKPADFYKTTPSLSLNWQPVGFIPVNLRAFYKEIFRMPSFNDLYYTFSGNTFLRPEFARQFNVGATSANNLGKGLIQTLDAQADVYFNKVTDKIVAVPGQNLFRWSMVNLDQAEIRGLDVNLRLGGGLAQSVSYHTLFAYSYQQAEDTTPGAAAGQQIPYLPRHSGSFTASADYGPAGLSYSFIYTGERYAQKANIRSNYVQPWYTHDLAVRYRTNSAAMPLSFVFEVNNLLNQQYEVIRNFPMPGRNYRLTVSCQFGNLKK